MLERIERGLHGTWLVVLGAVLLNALILAYLPSFKGPFVYDDIKGIVENPDLRQISNPWVVFRSHDSSLEFDRRPVTGLSFIANYAIGGLSPMTYRVTNVTLHLLVGLLLAYAVSLAARTFACQTPRLLGWGVTVIWLFHPLATNAVSYVYQRSEVLMSLFYLVAIVSVLRAGTSPRDREWRWLALAFLAAVLAALSKEPGLTLLLALPIVERVCVYDTWREWLMRRRWFYCLLAVVFLGLTVWIATGVRVGELDEGQVLSSPWEYFKTQCRVLVRYLSLVFWPHPLVFASVPKHVTGLFQWFPQFCVLVVFFGAGLLAGLRNRWILLPVSLFLVILAPTSSFLPIPLEPEAEFRMYLPSALIIVLAFVLVARWLRTQMAGASIGVSLFIVVLVCLAARTYSRNQDYSSGIRLWLSVVQEEPTHAKAWSNLAMQALSEGDWRLVELCSTNLIRVGLQLSDPLPIRTGRRLAALREIEVGDVETGLKTLETLVEEDSTPDIQLDLALALSRHGQADRAREVFERLPENLRKRPSGQLVDAELWLHAGETARARQVFDELAARSPESWRMRRLARWLSLEEEGKSQDE